MLLFHRLLKSVKYVVDTKGRPSAAVLDIEEWKRLLKWLDDEEDLQVAREAWLSWLPWVTTRTKPAGLKWEDIRDELDEYIVCPRAFVRTHAGVASRQTAPGKCATAREAFQRALQDELCRPARAKSWSATDNGAT